MTGVVPARKTGPKGDAGMAAPDGSEAAVRTIRVQAHVTRRRAGRAWAAGDVAEFVVLADGSPDAGEAQGLTPADLGMLLADPGFTVTGTE